MEAGSQAGSYACGGVDKAPSNYQPATATDATAAAADRRCVAVGDRVRCQEWHTMGINNNNNNNSSRLGINLVSWLLKPRSNLPFLILIRSLDFMQHVPT